MFDLPPALVEAVREQRAVLFLGSGASYDAVHPKGDRIPLGDTLRDLICDRFLGGGLKGKPLTAVSAMAASEAGLVQFQKYIRDLFDPFQPAPYHYMLPQFRWRAIATTNFDLIIERAYKAIPNALQKLVKSVKDGDLVDHRMNETLDPVGLYKLHGCIDHYTDLSIPLILSTEQYASYEQHRARFYARFRDLGHEYPIIFAGYSISDPHIQRILFDLTAQDISRPHYYLVSPHIDPIETRYWATHRVTCLSTTLANFLSSLNTVIPEIARELPPETGGGELSIRKHYNVANASESSDLRGFLKDDVTHIRVLMVIPLQIPTQFYRGNESGFGAIFQNLDVRRTVTDSVLVDAILLSDDPNRPSELFMLKGPAGNGKSVALKRIAWEAGITYDHIALFANGPSGIRIDPLEEIFTLTGKRTILFVDRVALVRKEIDDLLRTSRLRKIPLTIVGAERDNEWNIYCEFLEPFLKQEFPVRYLNQAEIRDLIALLERHNALGVLKDKEPADRIHAFTDVAERQLLVALHEATLGIAFEEIVLDEYRRIEPAIARRLYLEICALHQYGAPVRAGLISRTSGITFERFKREFIGPLQNVVLALQDQHSRDVYYRSRHQHVATLVFNRALPSAEEKFDLLASLGCRRGSGWNLKVA
jgi:hypothetical protein